MLLLADDFFLAAHDSISMRCRLADRVVGLGLAGALLGEQLLFRRVTIAGGQVRIVDHRPPPDALAHIVFDQLFAEEEITAVRDWLQFFSRDAYLRVGQRLVREGHLRVREVRRWMVWVRRAYEPARPTVGGSSESRLAAALIRRRWLEIADAVLAGLVAATGLDNYVLADAPLVARDHLQRLVDDLPSSLRELIGEVEAAIGDAVLNART